MTPVNQVADPDLMNNRFVATTIFNHNLSGKAGSESFEPIRRAHRNCAIAVETYVNLYAYVVKKQTKPEGFNL